MFPILERERASQKGVGGTYSRGAQVELYFTLKASFRKTQLNAANPKSKSSLCTKWSEDSMLGILGMV